MWFFEWFFKKAYAQTDSSQFGLEYAQNLNLGTQDIRETIFQVINVILGFTGIVFLILIMYGGYVYMISQDNADEQARAKKTIRNAVIGLLIVLASFSITQFILYQLGKATGMLEPCENIGEVQSCWVGGCEGDRVCTDSGVWGRCDIGSCDPSTIPVFYVRGTYPREGDTNTIRNLVLQVWFNQKVETGSLKIGSSEERIWLAQATSPELRVPGVLSITGNDTKVEFRGTDACLGEDGAQLYNDDGSPAMGCLAANAEYILMIENGSDGVQSLTGDDLNCGVSPCIVHFTTGNFVDLTRPRIQITDPGKMCVYNSSYPSADGSGPEVPIQAIVTDDYGVSYIHFTATDTDRNVSVGEATFTLSDISCIGTPGANAGVSCTAIYYWDRSGVDPLLTTNIQFDVTAQDLDDHNASTTFSKPLRPAYCCDGVLSGNETDIDCGGSCGSCDGETCSTDQALCDPNPAGCSSTFCDQTSCLCFSPPFIDAISPVVENVPSPGEETPVAASGNFVTIWGRNFGTEEGEVWFLGADTDGDGEKKGDADDIKGIAPRDVNSSCNDTWSNTEIVILVPDGTRSGPIEVRVKSQVAGVDPSQFIDRTDDFVRGKNIHDILIDNQYSAPGICRLSQTQGEFNQAFNISGINLDKQSIGAVSRTDHRVVFGNDSIAPLGDGAVWTPKEIQKALVPNVSQGTHSVHVIDNNARSNGLQFQVHPSGTLPYIADISPDDGGSKQYITITGDRFGSLPGQIKFFSYTSSEIFYGTSDFPVICQSDWWSDNQIIIKVPQASQGSYGVSVVNSLGESNIVRFDITNTPPGPGLCLMIPQSGIEGNFVDFYGEFFAPAQSGDDIIFHPALPGAMRGTWQHEASQNADHVVQAKVPGGVLSGPVILTKGSIESNPLNFTVGLCDPKDQNACDASGGTSICCGSGRYENMCVPEAIIDCDAGYAACSYQWSFSTWKEKVCVGEDCDNPPQVENDPSCTDGNFASPTPYSRDSMDAQRPYEENVCFNAGVSVRFTQKVFGLDSDHILLRECGSTSSDLSQCDVAGRKLSGDIIVGETSEEKSFFDFYPSDVLIPNTWYKLSILDTVTNEEGVLLDGDGDKYPGDPYWTAFKTATGEDEKGVICEPSQVIVNPKFTLLNFRGGKETFTAGAVNEQCFIVSGMDFSWSIQNENVASIDSTPHETQAIAKAGDEGDTLIDAAVSLSRGGSLRDSGQISVRYADLFVEDYWPSCESACVNAGIGAEMSLDLTNLEEGNVRMSFSEDSQGSSSDTVMLYECKSQTCLWPDLTRLNLVDRTGNTKAVAYERILPDGNTENQTGEYFITIAGDKLYDTFGNLYNGGALKTNTWYRVFLGKDITAWNGKTLEKLNFALGGGEDCDPGEEPWKSQGGCNTLECVNTGNSADCGNATIDAGEDCDDGNIINEDGCSSICINEGSNYDFQCGDGEEQGSDQADATEVSYTYYETLYTVSLDPGEECDPEAEPWKSKGGCSSSCVLLGSKKDAQAEPICGDEKLSWSEQCDPTVAPWLTSGGCTDDCLLSGVPHKGTTNSACGNSTKEIGEDCDDGNTINGDGCSDQCLHEGSLGSAVCGDGTVNTTGSDGFSWVFRTGVTQDACVVDHIEVLPHTYTSLYIGERYHTYVEAYSDSDECSQRGQRLNVQNSQYQWDWDPRNLGTLREFFPSNPTEDVDPKVGLLDLDPTNMSFGEEMEVIGGSTLNEVDQQDTVVASQITESGRESILCSENGGVCGELILQCGFNNDSQCQAGCDLSNEFCIDQPQITCSSHSDCVGVGRTTCCEVRPWVETCSPTKDQTFLTCESGATNQCRNVLIEAVFDTRLDPNNITGNVTVEKVSGECTLAKNSSLLKRVFAWVKQFIGFGVYSRAANCFVSGITSEVINEQGNSTITFTPTNYLDSLAQYRVTLHGDGNFSDDTVNGIRNLNGVALKGDYSWTFTTGDDICTIDYVEVMVARRQEGQISGNITKSDLFQCSGDDCPEDYIVDIPGTQHYYYAQARDSSGVSIAHVNYDWRFYSNPEELLKFQDISDTGATRRDNSDKQETLVVVNSAQKDARAQIGVRAEGEDPVVGTASQEIDAHVFLCNNPWPNFENFPFRDAENNCTISGAQPGEATTCSDFYFEMYYCRDAGDIKSSKDDLPALRSMSGTTASLEPLQFNCDESLYNSSTLPHSCVVVASSEGEDLGNPTKQRKLKELFFTYDDRNLIDAIGLRMYENKNGYSPERWYQNFVPNPGKPTPSTLDGYEAITDGRSIYAAGTNQTNDALYTNMYLLSYNEGAEATTMEIYSQLAENFKVNTNLDNSGVCVLPHLSAADVVEKWKWGLGEVYRNVMSTPIIADLDPTDENLVPQVIVNGYSYESSCTWNCDGRVQAIDGETGKKVDFFKPDFEDARLRTFGRSQIAVGNLDADQQLEIVAYGSGYCAGNPEESCATSVKSCSDGGECRKPGIMAFNHDGSLLWWTESKGTMSELLNIYDLDQDGNPEIVSGGVILDGRNGEYITTFTSGSYYSQTADIDNDGKNEFINGGKIYKVNGRESETFFTEKYTAPNGWLGPMNVGNFDTDAEPEFVINPNTTSVGVFNIQEGSTNLSPIWQKEFAIGACTNNENKSCASNSDCGNGEGTCSATIGGSPGAFTLADLNEDGITDIGINGKLRYVAINGEDGSILWEYTEDMDSEFHDPSGTTSTAFDFNMDGIPEILQRNTAHFYIFDGRTGAVLFKDNSRSGTLYEATPVVDIDNDESAEIIVPTNSAGDASGGIIVYEHKEKFWPGTRNIWNQDAYYIDNICDGTEGIGGCNYGDIPTVAIRPWERANNLRTNSYVGDEIRELIACSKDNECGEEGVCMADKTKLIRDTKRLADIRDMQVLADTYKDTYGVYPLLESGTYMKGASLSVWPSWGQTLPAYFGNLPADPLNEFYGCADPYDPTTCWDPVALKFSCPTDGYAYAYQTQVDGKIGKFYTSFEYADTFTKGSFVGTTAQCNDGADNDGDKKIDYPGDPGCKGYWDDTEDDTALDFGAACLSNYGTVAGDYDADKVADEVDNCKELENPTQEDSDNDGVGNACDVCPLDADPDHDDLCTYDFDGSPLDNCQNTYNPDQTDHDNDGVGDVCDRFSGPCTGDADGDGVCDESDNCPITHNPIPEGSSIQPDSNGNGVGDACETCADGLHDDDKDGVCGSGEIARVCDQSSAHYRQIFFQNPLTQGAVTLEDGESATLSFPACNAIFNVSTDLSYGVEVSKSSFYQIAASAFEPTPETSLVLKINYLEIDDREKNPSYIVRKIGDRVKFEISATPRESSSGPLTYQWQRLEIGAMVWMDISGANSNSYTVTLSSNDYYDKIRVKVVDSSNEDTVTSDPVQIFLNPQINSLREFYSETYSCVPIGWSAFFSISASPSERGDLAFQWLKEKNVPGTFDAIPGATSSTYSEKVDLLDSGKKMMVEVSNDTTREIGGEIAQDSSEFIVCSACTDNDFDGYGNGTGGNVECPFGKTETDCDDTNARQYPGRSEDCADAVDNDCDGKLDIQDPDCDMNNGCIDADGDGYGSTANPATCPSRNDCNDENSAIHPFAIEDCDNGFDDDCNGKIDLADEVCHTPGQEGLIKLNLQAEGNTYTTDISSLQVDKFISEESLNITSPNSGVNALASVLCGLPDGKDISVSLNTVIGGSVAVGPVSLSYCPYSDTKESSVEGDNCPHVYNPSQVDTDGDEIGDACDTCHDPDNDEYGTQGYALSGCVNGSVSDNCPQDPNPTQTDGDKDGVGDTCDPQTCGNYEVESSEECEKETVVLRTQVGDITSTVIYGSDGTTTGKDSKHQYDCTAECKWTGGWCGDGIVQTDKGEECEFAGTGTNNKDQYVCSSDCKWTGGWCGDLSIQTPSGEQCDVGSSGGELVKGGINYDYPYLCTESCSIDHESGWCGDGIVQKEFEQCDNIITTNKKLHMVFVLDTSGSMRDEAKSLCEAITKTTEKFENNGFTVKSSIYAMAVVPDSDGHDGYGDGIKDDQDGKCYNAGDEYSDCFSLEIYQGIKENCEADVKIIHSDPDYITQFGLSEAYPGETLLITDHPEDAGPAVSDIAHFEDWNTGYIPLIIPITDDYPQNGADGGSRNSEDDQSITEAVNAANEVETQSGQSGAYVFPVYGNQRGNNGKELYKIMADGTGGSVIEYYYKDEISADRMGCFIQGIINRLYCDGDGDGYFDCSLPSDECA